LYSHVIIFCAFFQGKAPFLSGWASGTAGDLGVMVGGLLNHFVFTLDHDGNPVGIEFLQQTLN
jgi:hypothetical protein